jgi:hypothetical protein
VGYTPTPGPEICPLRGHPRTTADGWPVRTSLADVPGQPAARGESPFEVAKAEGAAKAPAGFKHQELALGKQVCKRNDDVVSSALKSGPARVDCVSRGMALDQGLAASRHDGPQQVFSGSSFLDHGTSYGPLWPSAPPFAEGLAERLLDAVRTFASPVFACSTGVRLQLFSREARTCGGGDGHTVHRRGTNRVVTRGGRRVLQMASQVGGRAAGRGLRPDRARRGRPIDREIPMRAFLGGALTPYLRLRSRAQDRASRCRWCRRARYRHSRPWHRRCL